MSLLGRFDAKFGDVVDVAAVIDYLEGLGDS